MMVTVEQLVEWRLAGETEVLGVNLPQRHIFQRKYHMTCPGSSPDRRGGQSATYRLSYGVAAWPFTFRPRVLFVKFLTENGNIEPLCTGSRVINVIIRASRVVRVTNLIVTWPGLMLSCGTVMACVLRASCTASLRVIVWRYQDLSM
jgi:hypothetical protein